MTKKSKKRDFKRYKRVSTTVKILDGEFTAVFFSPEAINLEPWRSMFNNKEYRKRLCLVALDEVHCLAEWGDSFRPAYKQAAILRSLTTCPMIVMTATITEKMKQTILSDLLLVDVKTIAVIPDRTSKVQ
ncbi:ATP-dependent DNA helicase RecQ-like [Saccoglossus kowalevskii]|uniref:ATP-dependent DNA helicase Q-like 3-like n=1 Tax=Saccoglossus kowalevskii TaxID=10224 RepID=A0ABM0MFM3_SACKO|nr:PREDICTED: ATP-dependent DNA helicase Q-like 3-like [Saccoglossus kowalevskii]